MVGGVGGGELNTPAYPIRRPALDEALGEPMTSVSRHWYALLEFIAVSLGLGAEYAVSESTHYVVGKVKIISFNDTLCKV